jgi:hypothetical protein
MMLLFLGVAMMGVGLFLVGRAGRMEPAARAAPMSAGSAVRRSPSVQGGSAMPAPASGKAGLLAGARLHQKLTYKHPRRGDLTGIIQGTIAYAELWQRRKAPSEPWVPTGNQFTAHWLGDTLIYSWKDRLFVLDSYESITDAEIAQQILPQARAFGQSDETAEVAFAYPPASWVIMDIGKFRVDRAEGEGLRLQSGAVGRFLHARGGSGNEGQVLVVEDYLEGGGGQDTVWQGWQVGWDDLISIR